jgi:hypothetical protein
VPLGPLLRDLPAAVRAVQDDLVVASSQLAVAVRDTRPAHGRAPDRC